MLCHTRVVNVIRAKHSAQASTHLCQPYERTHTEQRAGYPDVNFLVNNAYSDYTGAPPFM
jgi:hypothetical protein